MGNGNLLTNQSNFISNHSIGNYWIPVSDLLLFV